jgi:hypothetical protein
MNRLFLSRAVWRWFMFTALLVAVSGVWAQDSDRLIGRDAATGLDYSIERISGQAYRALLTLPTGKRIRADIDDATGRVAVRVEAVGASPGGAPGLSAAEIALIKNLGDRLSAGKGRSAEVLLGLFAWLGEAPADTSIDTVQDRSNSTLAVTSLCRQAGQAGVATYDLEDGTVVNRDIVISRCYDVAGDCLGRCGSGCGGAPGAAIQRITQDCLNHDQCRRDTGSNTTAPCADEFRAAVDDFLSAPDCGSFTGTWADGFGYQWTLTQRSGGGITGSVSAASCGSYAVRGNHTGSTVSLTATVPVPPDGCCSSFTYTGACDGCDAAAGSWTNACSFSGSWTMSRSLSSLIEQMLSRSPGPAPASSGR